MSQSKAAKKSLLYTAQGFKPYQPSIKPLTPAHEKMLPIVDPVTGLEPDTKSLDELKQIAKEMGIKGWNFFKDPQKLQSKIDDQIRFTDLGD